MPSDRQVMSPDGTSIACRFTGSGPPIVLVHGTGGDHSSFRFVEPILAERFTVCAIDRRGRRLSGDSRSAYRIEQEFADVAAVVNSLGQPVDLFGHSFGATVALGASLLTSNLRKLVLYEPAPGIQSAAPDVVARLEALLAQDRREELLTEMLTGLAGLGSEELEQFKASPAWAPRVKAAHTIPREVRAEEEYRPDPAVFAAVSAPTLLLLGTESPEWAWRGTEAVHGLLANSRVVALEHQGHIATLTAPALVADQVMRFLLAP